MNSVVGVTDYRHQETLPISVEPWNRRKPSVLTHSAYLVPPGLLPKMAKHASVALDPLLVMFAFTVPPWFAFEDTDYYGRCHNSVLSV